VTSVADEDEVDLLVNARWWIGNAASAHAGTVNIIQDLIAEVDRLRASQLPDGGKWKTERGSMSTYLGLGTYFVPGPLHTHVRRVWHGPVEPIGDDQDGVRYGQHQPGSEEQQ
jgi:hypothetical protein